MHTNPTPVVVGIDGPAETVAAAIHLGAWEASRRHTALRLVAAADGTLPAHPGYDAFEFAACFAAAMAAAVRDSYPMLDVESAAHPEKPDHALVDGGNDAALLVVAGDARLYFGSLPGGKIAAHVAAHAPVPVIVLPPLRDPRGSDRRVVVGVDGSTGSADAIGFAFDEADARGATLHAVSVWDLPARRGFRRIVAPELEPMRRAAEDALADAVAPWVEKYPDVPVIRDAVRHTSPMQLLCQAAAEAELLVVGSRGHGGYVSHVLGSVTAGLVHYSPTPVAVVPPVGAVR